MKHKIVVFDNRLLPEAQQQIQTYSAEPIIFPKDHNISETELIEKTGNANIVLVSPWHKITASYLDACPSIKYICLCGTSTANIDLDELKKRNIKYFRI